MDRKRVVITGLGAITVLGSSVQQYWDGLVQGKSGIRRITQFDASNLPCQIAGEIPDFEVEKYMDRKEARRLPRSSQIALASAIQAVADAGLPETMPDGERSSVVYGTAIGGLEKIDEGIQILRSQGFERVNPFTVPGRYSQPICFFNLPPISMPWTQQHHRDCLRHRHPGDWRGCRVDPPRCG